MKINFKKLREIEVSHQPTPVTLSVITDMIQTFLHYPIVGGDMSKAGEYHIAYNSLKDLGILEDDEPAKDIQQINS